MITFWMMTVFPRQITLLIGRERMVYIVLYY